MKLYIDPGTGSMLFAILIGIIGALNFALRGWIIKLRFLLSGGEKTAVDQEKHPLAVFVDDKRYWNVMEPVCRELDRRGLDVAYLTASPDDPALQNPYAHVHAEFLGEGNKAFAKLNFLRANVLLSTTPGSTSGSARRAWTAMCTSYTRPTRSPATGCSASTITTQSSSPATIRSATCARSRRCAACPPRRS